MIDFEKVRAELALKQGFLMDRDDPALVTAALIEAFLVQSVSTLNEEQAANVKALVNGVRQGVEEGQKTAKRIVTEGAALVSDQVHVAVTSAMTESEERIKKTLNRHLEVMNDMNKDVRVSRNISIVAAGISVICTFITLSAMAAAIT